MRTWLSIASLLAACASSSPPPPARTAPRVAARASVPLLRFPDPADIEVLIDAVPEPELHTLVPNAAYVERWDIETPVPARDSSYEGQGPLEAMIDSLAAEHRFAITRSESARCAARELARFHVVNRARAPDDVMTHVIAVCGVGTPHVLHSSHFAPVPASLSDERALALLLRGAEHVVRGAIEHGGRVGAGFARAGDMAAIEIVAASPELVVLRNEPPGADGFATVRFRAEVEVDAITGVITQGEYGVAACVAGAELSAPEHELRCPIAQGDATAIVRISGSHVGQMSPRRLGVVIARRSPDARPPFVRRALGDPAIVESDEDAGAAALERVNALRASRGLAPLVLEPAQSAESRRVLPYLMDWARGHAGEPNPFVLHLLAGRAIENGTIAGGSTAIAVVSGSRDVSRALGAMLEDASGRGALLDPLARRIAVGARAATDHDALAIFVTTYRVFADVDHARDADAVFERITAARAERGLPPPRRLRDLSALEARAQNVAERGANPIFELMNGMYEEMPRVGGSCIAMFQEVPFVEVWPVPDELLHSARLAVGIVVTHTRAEGAAWGQYAIGILRCLDR